MSQINENFNFLLGSSNHGFMVFISENNIQRITLLTSRSLFEEKEKRSKKWTKRQLMFTINITIFLWKRFSTFFATRKKGKVMTFHVRVLSFPLCICLIYLSVAPITSLLVSKKWCECMLSFCGFCLYQCHSRN